MKSCCLNWPCSVSPLFQVLGSELFFLMFSADKRLRFCAIKVGSDSAIITCRVGACHV